MADEDTLKAAAQRLKNALFGTGYSLPSPGFVGIGGGVIHVYMHATRKAWRGDTPPVWEGFPVNYTFGIGPIIAA